MLQESQMNLLRSAMAQVEAYQETLLETRGKIALDELCGEKEPVTLGTFGKSMLMLVKIPCLFWLCLTAHSFSVQILSDEVTRLEKLHRAKGHIVRSLPRTTERDQALVFLSYWAYIN
jgi:ABC-type cobalamin transport system permease subunit